MKLNAGLISTSEPSRQARESEYVSAHSMTASAFVAFASECFRVRDRVSYFIYTPGEG